MTQQDQGNEILLCTGEAGILRFNSWALSDADRAQPQVIWSKFRKFECLG